MHAEYASFIHVDDYLGIIPDLDTIFNLPNYSF